MALRRSTTPIHFVFLNFELSLDRRNSLRKPPVPSKSFGQRTASVEGLREVARTLDRPAVRDQMTLPGMDQWKSSADPCETSAHQTQQNATCAPPIATVGSQQNNFSNGSSNSSSCSPAVNPTNYAGQTPVNVEVPPIQVTEINGRLMVPVATTADGFTWDVSFQDLDVSTT